MLRPHFLRRWTAGFLLVIIATAASIDYWGVQRLTEEARLEGREVLAAELRALHGVVFGVMAAALAAGAAIGYFASRRIARPIADVTRAADAIAGGDYRQRVPVDGAGELESLARAFNAMARQFEQRVETITRDRKELRAILGGMIEGVVAVDRDECVVHMNDAASRILGTSAEESAGRKIWEVCRIREICDTLSRALTSGDVQKGEARRMQKPRDQVIEVHAAPLRDSENALVGAVAVLHDVTELRMLAGVRQDFVANVSHELKTPIAAIRGLAETLAEDNAMPEETQKRFMVKIHNQSLRLSTLVMDLLTLARLDTDEGLLEAQPLDLREPVRATVQAFQGAADERGIRLELAVPEHAITVRGDQQALAQVVSNLLDNALKYTQRGGRVALRLTNSGNAARLAVEDTGIGMERRHLDRIFERFYRVDKARSRDLGGTGLGLAIVKHICLKHSGHVSVESALGQGSTFTVELPLAVAD
ncbi:MAG: cell wall metabolism sensor histidine kinase WalK [Planctomycetes bacterium]|nr:cell wall metabolism sensor histidine kinase WalK [Planctomycetota bacterium]